MLNFTSEYPAKETWKDVVGYEGWYQVSSLGNVRRVKMGRGVPRRNSLKHRINHKGYASVVLCRVIDGKSTQINRFVHHLVAEAFIALRPSSDHQINHKDGDKINNCPQNLQWVTNAENMRHSWRMALRTNFGQNNHTSKLTEKDVYEIISLKGKVSQRQLSKKYGVGLNQIKGIHRGISWKHITRQSSVYQHLKTTPILNYPKPRGEEASNAKLTLEQVKEIRRLFPTHSNKELAKMYGVSRDCIYHVRIGKTWRESN